MDKEICTLVVSYNKGSQHCHRVKHKALDLEVEAQDYKESRSGGLGDVSQLLRVFLKDFALSSYLERQFYQS